MCSNLQIASLNIRGMNNFKKRRKLFHYLHKTEHDIIFIQESHSTKHQERLWKNQWGDQIYYSHGDHNARGVLILIKKKVPIKIVKIHADNQGRWLLLEANYENLQLIIGNVYAPNEDNPVFFENLFDVLEQIPIDLKILGGDYNLHMDIKMDKEGGSNVTNCLAQKLLQEFLNKENMVDVWRTSHPYDRVYTWYRTNPKVIMTRLDYLFASSLLNSIMDSSGIDPISFSDHSLVWMKLSCASGTKGPGFWKLNTSLLNDEKYIEIINEKIEEILKTPFESAQKKWDYIKFKVKSLSIKYASNKKKSEVNKMAVLEKKLKTIQQRISDREFLTPTTTIEQEIESMEMIKKEIDALLEIKTRGAMIRSRADWYQFGEKSSKYFYKLEQTNFNKKNRYKLIVDDKIITDEKEILHEQNNHFEKQFDYQPVKHDVNYLKKLESPKLTHFQRVKLDSPIVDYEIYEAIKQMHKNKTPGPDGLPIEFYHKFWNKIYKIVYTVIKDMSEMGPTIEESRGIISLLDKPNKNPLYINNWRPISLLNTDYKIFSKILANRIYDVLPDIIHEDQVGFLKERYIGENIMSLNALIEHLKYNDQEGVLISADMEKAFDSVHWETFYSFFRIFWIRYPLLQYDQNAL